MNKKEQPSPDELQSEADFERTIKELIGWKRKEHLYYHTWRSIHSPAGFPDCVFGWLEPTPRLIFAELKSEKGELSAEQYFWLSLLQQQGQEAYLWKPSDWDEIVEILER